VENFYSLIGDRWYYIGVKCIVCGKGVKKPTWAEVVPLHITCENSTCIKFFKEYQRVREHCTYKDFVNKRRTLKAQILYLKKDIKRLEKLIKIYVNIKDKKERIS